MKKIIIYNNHGEKIIVTKTDDQHFYVIHEDYDKTARLEIRSIGGLFFSLLDVNEDMPVAIDTRELYEILNAYSKLGGIPNLLGLTPIEINSGAK